MAYTLGFVIGVVSVAIFSGVASYFAWEKWTKDQHSGKKMFFAFLCFFAGGLMGIFGSIPALTISVYLAYAYRVKAKTKDKAGRRSSDNDDDDTELIAG